MDRDHDSHQGQVRLPRYDAAGPVAGADQSGGTHAAQARRDGIRRVRRMSNWTAAALLVGTGATAVALAHHAFPATTSAAGTTSSGVVTTGAQGTGAPQVSGPVATSGGSGVTVTTVRHVVNGHVVVTQVRHVAAYHDN
jgi:hypothetical protein